MCSDNELSLSSYKLFSLPSHELSKIWFAGYTCISLHVCLWDLPLNEKKCFFNVYRLLFQYFGELLLSSSMPIIFQCNHSMSCPVFVVAMVIPRLELLLRSQMYKLKIWRENSCVFCRHHRSYTVNPNCLFAYSMTDVRIKVSSDIYGA